MKNKLLILFVFLGMVIRAAIMAANLDIVKLPDSELYLQIAKNYYEGNFAPNLVRLPGYPMFLYAIFLIFGWGKLKIVYLFQHLLTLVASILIFKIIENQNNNKRWQSIFGVLIFFSPNIWQWGQILMPEALLIFLTSFIIYLFFQNQHILSLPIIFSLGFIKPVYLIFSLTYLFCLFIFRKSFRSVLISFFIMFVFFVLFYMSLNSRSNHLFALSASDATTIFGKIVNFEMENCSSLSKKNTIFSSRLNSYLDRDGKRDWYQFVYSFKNDGWGENAKTFLMTYEFNKQVINNCPVEYYVKSTAAFYHTFVDFDFYLPKKNDFIYLFGKLNNLIVFIAFATLLIKIKTVWRRKKLLLILLFIFYNLFSIYLFAADSFSRLRAPIELLIYLFLFLLINDEKTAEKTAKS